MIIITGPSLDTSKNVSGISTVVQMIIRNNDRRHYYHFEVGKPDQQARNFSYVFKLVGDYFKWMMLVLRMGPSLIHFNLPLNGRSVTRDMLFIMIAKALGKRLVIHLHGGRFYMFPDDSFLLKYAIKLCLAGGNIKIALSDTEKEVLENKLNLKNVIVLPNCIEVDKLNMSRGLITKEAVILFLGRIEMNKGIGIIYESLSQLKESGVSFRFIMAGSGPDEKEYIEKFKALLGSNFEFRGVVSGVDKAQLFLSSHVFILPSFFEGLPMALLESMSYGLVPIATNVGSIGHVIDHGKNGFLVNVHETSPIVSHMLQMIRDEILFGQLSDSARNTIIRNFNSKKYIDKLNSIYNDEPGN